MVHNVHAIDALLSDGTQARFGPESEMASAPARLRELADRLRAIGERERDEIGRQVPKVMRRVGGYNIDVFNPQSERPYTADGSVNYAHLLVGSEGTLAWTRSLTLKLAPLPRHRTLGVVSFPTLYRAMECARHIVGLGPSAVELVDRTMIDLARGNPAFRPVIERALIGEPEAILLVEFVGDGAEGPLRRLDDLVALMGDLGLPGRVVRMTDAARAEGAVGGAQGRAQHHDEHARRRQAGVVHRGLRRAARAPGRLRRPPVRGVSPARHARHVVRARVGRHAARAADPRHAPRRRGQDARDRRGGERHRARVQGRVLRRARRRPRAQRVGRVAVRSAPHARIRGDQGPVRSRRTHESGQDRARHADGRRVRCSAFARVPRRSRWRPRSTGRRGTCRAIRSRGR